MDPIMINRLARIRAAEMIQTGPTARGYQPRQANRPVATLLAHLGAALVAAGQKLQATQPVSEVKPAL
jgi:hypothetical protein